MIDRWSLPGPLFFLRQTSDLLRDGQNLVLATPSTCVDGLGRALESFLHSEGWNFAHSFSALSDDSAAPIDQLFSVLELDHERLSRRSVSQLRQCLPSGKLVLVQDVGSAVWPKWKRLLDDYEAASRGVSAFDRSLIILITKGVEIDELPRRAAALQSMIWNDNVGEFDLLLYITDALRERRRIDFRAKLLARIISGLALWDFDLADFLIDQTPEELFQPKLILQEALHYFEGNTEIGPSWNHGGRLLFDGVELIHPFILLKNGDQSREINRRMWAAQAAEILPSLEIRRRNLAARMNNLVTLPVKIDEELVHDLLDLEIGQLSYIAHSRGLTRDIRNTAERWKRIRNKLAHLDVLGADEALAKDLLTSGWR